MTVCIYENCAVLRIRTHLECRCLSYMKKASIIWKNQMPITFEKLWKKVEHHYNCF